MIKRLKKILRDGSLKRGFSDQGQVIFVAVVWGVFFVLLFTLGACADRSNPKVEPAVKAEVIPTPEPHRYLVRLSWIGSRETEQWLIHRKKKDSALESEQLGLLDASATGFTDAKPEEGNDYSYYLGALNGPHYVVIGKTAVSIPKDIAVTSPVTLSEDTKWNAGRVFFKENGRILTLGHALSITTSELVAENGVIETFNDGATKAPDYFGNSANDIRVFAKRATGLLTIWGRGENGGAGLTGKAGAVGSRGEKGRNALTTHSNVDVVCNCGSLARSLKNQLQNGNVIEQILAWQQIVLQKQLHRCISEPTDGRPGSQGKPGERGSDGGRGGDSPKIFVQVKEPSNFQVKAYPIAGVGGLSGKGGQGGPGGQGGDPGDHDLDFFEVCHRANPGPVGAQGELGQDGAIGAPGRVLPMCIDLGGTRFGDCDAFQNEGGSL